MSETLHAVVGRGEAFLTLAREQARDGLSWAEFGCLLVELLYLAVAALDVVQGLSGAEKKAIALTAVAALFDSFADRCVPIAAWPAWLIIRPAVRLLIMSLSAGAIEAILRISRSPAQ